MNPPDYFWTAEVWGDVPGASPGPAVAVGHGVFLHGGRQAEQRELLQQTQLACWLVGDLQGRHREAEPIGYLEAWPS